MNDNNWQDRRWTPERIRTLRETLNRSQNEMAKLLGVAGQTIFRWEKGKSVPRHKMIRRLKKMEGHLITRKLQENERLAPVLKRKEEGRSPSEPQEIREMVRGNRLKVHEGMNVTLREAHKALERSWKVLRQSGELFRDK